jgi:uncharacterized protein GlcG (DUF336 family)
VVRGGFPLVRDGSIMSAIGVSTGTIDRVAELGDAAY